MFQNINSFHGNGIVIDQKDILSDFHNLLKTLSAVETVVPPYIGGVYYKVNFHPYF